MQFTKMWRSGVAAAVVAGGMVVGAPVPEARGQFAVVQVAGTTAGNPMSRPVFVTSPMGDYKRLFIVEKQGRIRVLDITTPVPALQQDTAPFLDIRSLCPTLAAGNTGNQDERGLLGLAFHPQYMTNGKFYVYYTALGVSGLPNSATYYCNVVEYTNPTPTGNIANAGSARILMQIPHPQTNHNGGWMAFGPDGFLYLVVGDGGGAGDDEPGHNASIGNGQDTGTPLGKMMRIDVNVTTQPAQGPFVAGSIASYGIPANNPTIPVPIGATTSRREIWAYGLRNPWRCSFDRLTGDLWIGDVGQGLWEEIDFQPALTAQNLAQVAGRNYGWRCWEGTVSFNDNSGTCATAYNTGGLTGPVGVYAHGAIPTPAPPLTFLNITGTCSITGGYVYRGCAIPELAGKYLFTDYCTGRIYTTQLNGSNVLDQPVDQSSVIYAGSAVTVPTLPSVTRPAGAIVSFGEDSYGEMYIVDQPNARIFKIVRATAGTVVNANCDFNTDGVKSVQDIFDFLASYFSTGTAADFNRSGAITVQDIFDFLGCYFNACNQ
jgi:hypothetical protein